MSNPQTRTGRIRPRLRYAVLATTLGLAAALAGSAGGGLGGCTNDPFDPESVPNSPPTITFFASPPPDGELHPTSYYNRTFHWSGSDRDGFVREFYVSIRLDADVPAPWDTTTATDTTMTFVTDDEGRAEATFYLACRDNRGALSDTLVQYVPLRNSPPAVGFQSGFDPLRNVQREFVYEGEAVVDTIYWNYGITSFRLFALDVDGSETMDDHYLYTFAQPLPEEIVDYDAPDADPETAWIRVPFGGVAPVQEFEIFVQGLAPGERTLTVSVGDEANAGIPFTYTWVVRAPRGPVLFVPDGTPSVTEHFFANFADTYFGPESWDSYEFWIGFPEEQRVLVETFRLFDVVVWFDGGSTSPIFNQAAARGGPLQTYVDPTDGGEPGRLLVVSAGVCGGNSNLPNPFIQQVLGVSPTGSPQTQLAFQPGHIALGLQPHLPSLTAASAQGRGIGMNPLEGTEALYQMEECPRCYTSRPPWDPIVAVRRPDRATEALARVVSVSVQLEYWTPDEAIAALGTIMNDELGVAQP